MRLHLTNFFLLILGTFGISGLKWVRVNIPQYRIPGETATLQCHYNLGNSSLYAVKWYKEHEEFYRFVPKARPQSSSYKVDGVYVDVSKIVYYFIVYHKFFFKKFKKQNFIQKIN